VQAYLHSAVGAALIPHLPLPLLNQHHLPLITNLFDLNTHHPISGISYLLHFAIASLTLICRLNYIRLISLMPVHVHHRYFHHP